jgi:hypothetical protein
MDPDSASTQVRTGTSKTNPVLVGGLVMGVLSALPIISAGNLCCCLWIITGGLVAAYVLQQNQPAPITPGDGALVGLLAGLAGAGIYLVLSIPITFLVAPLQRKVLEGLMERANGIPPEFREYMGGYVGGAVGLMIGFVFMLMTGAVFSTLGGLLGAVFFRKEPPPATDASSSS